MGQTFRPARPVHDSRGLRLPTKRQKVLSPGGLDGAGERKRFDSKGTMRQILGRWPIDRDELIGDHGSDVRTEAR